MKCDIWRLCKQKKNFRNPRCWQVSRLEFWCKIRQRKIDKTSNFNFNPEFSHRQMKKPLFLICTNARERDGNSQLKACPTRTYPIARFSPSSNCFFAAFPFHHGRPENTFFHLNSLAVTRACVPSELLPFSGKWKLHFFLFPTEILADKEKVVGDAINSSIGKTRLDQQINNVKETTAGVCTFPPFGFFPISGLVAGSGHEASSDDWAQLEWLFMAEAVTVFLSKSEALKTINRTVLKCLIGRAMSSLVNSLDFERL